MTDKGGKAAAGGSTLSPAFLEEIVRRVVETVQPEKIILFGSAARGEMGRDSDIDLLVELDEPTFDHYMDLKFFLEELLGRPVDLVLKDAVKPRLRKPIMAEAVIFAIHDHHFPLTPPPNKH
jgi:predicted nucleotidyltransferase